MISVLGSANLDQIATVRRLPAPGETVAASSFALAPGGKGANQALATRRAGAAVRFVGAVGNDAFAQPALALLRADGVDLSAVRTVEGPTGVALILVDESGENVIAVAAGANAEVGEADAEAALGGASIVLLQGEIPAAATRRALELARERSVTSVFNTAPFDAATAELAALACIVIANETEFEQLTGARGEAARAAIQAWAGERGQTVIVTAGADGAWAADGRELLHAPAPAIAAVDTVGAGDTFCGYFAAGLGASLGLKAALQRATRAASFACLRPGAQPSIPWASDLGS